MAPAGRWERATGCSADPELAAALRGTGAAPVTAVTTDLFYDGGAHLEEWLAAGARVVEMEAATILSVAGGEEPARACCWA